LVSSSSASSGNGGARLEVAGGAGPVAGSAITPRFKIPKRKDPPTAEAMRQSDRDRVVRAEELFLKSPDAKALFDETQ
jgi:hypothetical protein